ncbi:hypothetical protein BX600DRAFT_50630 [Xylariales sp. PMI_506]|nr:hypothetical protein BX600DRAFT_50630 [Xylariales sp. PMI_506]
MPSRIAVDPNGDILLQVPYLPRLPVRISVPPRARSPDDSVIDAQSRDDGVLVTMKSHAQETPPASEVRELLVSSKILTVASPVFRAMLHGHFSEGVSLQEAKASGGASPFVLELPDDDGEAMTLLCKLLHHAARDVPSRPDPELLENLAIACDKYHCVSVLRFCGGLWVRNWLHLWQSNPIATLDDICRLVVFCYVVDLEFEFAEVVWELLLSHQGPLMGLKTQAVIVLDHPLLNHNIGAIFDAKRFQFCAMYHRAVMAPYTTWELSSLTQGCQRAAIGLGLYSKALRDRGIFPYDLEFSQHRFRDLLHSADKLGIITLPACSNPMSRRACLCFNDRYENMAKDVQAAVQEIQSHKMWFGCLDCLKAGDTVRAGDDCRLGHGTVAPLPGADDK